MRVSQSAFALPKCINLWVFGCAQPYVRYSSIKAKAITILSFHESCIPEDGGQWAEVRSQKPEARDHKPETRVKMTLLKLEKGFFNSFFFKLFSGRSSLTLT